MISLAEAQRTDRGTDIRDAAEREAREAAEEYVRLCRLYAERRRMNRLLTVLALASSVLLASWVAS